MSDTQAWLLGNAVILIYHIWIIRFDGAIVLEGWKSFFLHEFPGPSLSAEAIVIYTWILLFLQAVWFVICVFVPELRWLL